MKVHEATAHLHKLLQTQSVDHSHHLRPMGAYEHRTIGTWVHLGILSDVPIWHPRTHDANREQSLRNPDYRKHVRMRIEFALFNDTVVYLVWSELSMPLIE